MKNSVTKRAFKTLQRLRPCPAPVVLMATALLVILASGLIMAGCSYTRILRNRLASPHRVEDFENAVLFQYEAPQARHVNVCGNWDDNGWCGTETSGRFDHGIGSMSDDDGDGIWSVVLPLKPGRYLYKYAVDWGIRWESDANNPLSEEDGFGGVNSILILR